MSAVVASQRIDHLSQPKKLPDAYQEDRRSVYWLDKLPTETEGTTKFVVNKHQENLCKPKSIHNEWTGDRPTPKWEVSKAAQQAEASERVSALSQSKGCHKDFVPERPVRTQVSKAAMNASPSARIEQLAKEKTYEPLKIKESYEFDSYVWDQEISKAAKNAKCSDRLETLAEPKQFHSSFQFAKPIQWETTESSKKAIATLRIQQLARPTSRGKTENYDPYKVSSAAVHARPTPRIDELATPIPRKVRQKKTQNAAGN
ncbi:sperm microtubule associated protein 2-like isoform X2 [Apostichopus japonicus]|uniref:sperm microtubule associated protein 2-like isoform X2 n=1 Tax=Stichopus japonicus TaxID=307972 RepID=UPI003AB716AC